MVVVAMVYFYIGNVNSKENIAKCAVGFISSEMLDNNSSVTLEKVSETPYPLYEIKLKIQDEDFISYVTRDGHTLFPQGILTNYEGPERMDVIYSNTINYINKNLLNNTMAEIDRITDTGSFYEIALNIEGVKFTSYVTKDGSVLFPQGVVIDC